jgi:hypothetical protein
MWPVWLYNISPHYFMNGTYFEKKIIGLEVGVLFSSTNVSRTLGSWFRTSENNIHIYVQLDVTLFC